MPHSLQPLRRVILASAGLLALFIMLSAAVTLRLLAGFDLAIAYSMAYVGHPLLDAWSMAAANFLAIEMAVFWGLLTSAVLWRLGAGWYSLAPLAFLIPTGVEGVMKLTIPQLPPPPELHFHDVDGYAFGYYPTKGAYPSGHALRSAFLCVFVAVILWRRDSALSRWLAAAAVILMFALVGSRIYVAWHWTSDVIGGLLLGSATALVAAAPLARRLVRAPTSEQVPTRVR